MALSLYSSNGPDKISQWLCTILVSLFLMLQTTLVVQREQSMRHVRLCVRTITFEVNNFDLDILQAGSSLHSICCIPRSRS